MGMRGKVCLFEYEDRRVVVSYGLIYLAGDTAVHRCDARAKIVLLLVVSVAIFCAGGWVPLAVLAALAVGLLIAAEIPLALASRMLVPVYVLAAFSVVFNVMAHPGIEGLGTGLFFAVRMIVLVLASYVVCLTTSSSELLDAFGWFIGPLRTLKVPVDDIALTLALSVRFIPVIQQEFARIRAAQLSRGGDATGSFARRLAVWGSAFGALFVGLFRHADLLALAMDARCYGAGGARTRLPKQR